MPTRSRSVHRVVLPLVLLFAAREGYAQGSITHQITLSGNQSWCDDTMINGLFSQLNAFRVQNGVPALAMDTLGMKDAEIRATQFAAYMVSNPPGSPGFNPHTGYDTTAASLGYYLISENLAYITTSPSNIVLSGWQDSLHLAAMLASQANVAGVSCIYSNGIPYWTYEPGYNSGVVTPPSPSTNPPTLDSEQWSFLTLLNNYRAQNGAGPLQVSVALQESSQWMSNDMATNNGFSHTDSLGRDPFTRMSSFGYSYFPAGENIAAGYSDAQNTLTQWATACDADISGNCTYAHRVNMLNASYVVIGIGRAYSSTSIYGWYWTTDFGGVLDPTITPPNPGQAPTIGSFTATPTSIVAGQSSTLAWSVSGASSLALDNGIGDVSTLTSRIVSPSQTTTYKLSATNANGTSTAFATVTVTMPVCTYTISQSLRTIASSGGTGSVGVTAGAACAWTASSNAAWLTITSGSSGTSNGTVAYSVAANQTASQRQGILTIGGKAFTVTEPGSIHLASKAGIIRSSASMLGEDVNGNITWNVGTDRAGNFGQAGDQIIFGDWDGSGTTKMGIFRASSGLMALDMNGNLQWDPGIDKVGNFGQPGDMAIVGDWTGDGKSKVGIYRPSAAFFTLDMNGNLGWDPGVDKTGIFGAVGDTPIVGDWTGDGRTKVGIFRGGTWALDMNGNLTFDNGVDAVGGIGQAGDIPLLGDWNGDGRTKVGIYRASAAMFGLDYNGNLSWDASDRAGNYGAVGDTPILGDWDGTGVTRIGIYRAGTWALDVNGNIAWNSGIDRVGGFGVPGDLPIVGKWQ